MSTTVSNAYDDLITALRSLEKVLGPAVAVQFEAPPGGSGELAPNGIPNPTLDTVIDPRRMGLSDAVKATGKTFVEITAAINEQTESLSAALTRWEGSSHGGN